MRPKVKYAVIHRHRSESVMCKFFEVSRSGYYDFVKRTGKPEQDTELADEIRTCQRSTGNTYGYRRVWLWLKHRKIHNGNAMAENFFSILKTECIYRHKPKTFQEADDLIDKYIPFYNYERIQTKTGMAPLTLRHSA